MKIEDLTPEYIEKCYRETKLAVATEEPLKRFKNITCGCALGAAAVAKRGGSCDEFGEMRESEDVAPLLGIHIGLAECYGLGFDLAMYGQRPKNELDDDFNGAGLVAHLLGHRVGTHIKKLVDAGELPDGDALLTKAFNEDA